MRCTCPLLLWCGALLGRALRPTPRVPIYRRANVVARTSLILAEDDASPIDLYDEVSGRYLRCFPGAFLDLEDGAAPIVIATPCDAPMAFAPSIDGDDDDATWTILQDNDDRMGAVFDEAAALVRDELDDCVMVRSALFPTLSGDAFDEDDEDFEEELEEAMDEFDAADDGDDDEAEVLSLVATFSVPALGDREFDMMRIEQVYQILARRRGDGSYAILPEADSEALRPRIAEVIAESEDDLYGDIIIDP